MSEDMCEIKKKVEEQCRVGKCLKLYQEYQECGKRVEGKEGKHCEPHYWDYLACVDKCVAPKLFKELK
eukprot:TRINITY_DN136795_c0_g1_i1.p1 TRINITY_DN136795_c0_g1~~TRINITY_DN136795_c0_g1_i1.p1  ORF type:complete len:68 (+),score=16.57 TRINITY_DN136795_c0_g1_i1:77-280(+)